jgi:hypothetical protein
MNCPHEQFQGTWAGDNQTGLVCLSRMEQIRSHMTRRWWCNSLPQAGGEVGLWRSYFDSFDNSSGLNAHVWDGSSVQGLMTLSTNGGTFSLSRSGGTVTGYFNGRPLHAETRSAPLIEKIVPGGRRTLRRRCGRIRQNCARIAAELAFDISAPFCQYRTMRGDKSQFSSAGSTSSKARGGAA